MNRSLALVLPVILLGIVALAACSGVVPAPATQAAPLASAAMAPTRFPPATELPKARSAGAVIPQAITALPPVTSSTVAAIPTQSARPVPATVVGSTSQPVPNGVRISLPYRAWGVGPEGKFYLLDAAGLLHRFSSDLSQPLDSSGPLFGSSDPGRAYLDMNDGFLVIASETLTRTLVLERESFARRGELDRGGPVALDGLRRLFVMAGEAVWAYDLQDLNASPVAVTTWPVDAFTPRPRALTVDTAGRMLLVTLHDVSASPPHQQEWYAAYGLESLHPLRSFPPQLGILTRPSVGGETIVAGMAALNGFLGSKLAVFDRDGNEVAAAKPFDGLPVVDGRGEFIYVLRPRGTWILRTSDLSVVAVDPQIGNTAAGLLLSPDGSRLYTVGDGELRVQETSRLRSTGFAALPGPILSNWFDPAQAEAFRGHFFPVAGSAETGFLQIGGYGETWRSQDRGTTWQLLPGLVYPSFHYVTHLSISPDFARDHTLVAVAQSSPAFLRSVDAGDTWAEWEPQVAFVSDRDGNREIYVAERGAPRGGPAQHLVRRTVSPAAEENPAWSPGWTRIAFQSNRNGNWDIFTIRADCNPSAPGAGQQCDEQQLTDDPADDMLPAWSPDSRWIAFVSMRGGKPDIYVAAASGGAAARLTTSESGAWRPAWLPDSRRLLFTATSPDGTNNIMMATIAEGLAGGPSLAEIVPFANSPYDERDASVAREYVVYLSNEPGHPATYRRYNYDRATSFPSTSGAQAEAHPAALDDSESTVLITLEQNGRMGIYRATTAGYQPYFVDGAFNGQPAAGPVPSQPAADWSDKRIREWQK